MPGRKGRIKLPPGDKAHGRRASTASAGEAAESYQPEGTQGATSGEAASEQELEGVESAEPAAAGQDATSMNSTPQSSESGWSVVERPENDSAEEAPGVEGQAAAPDEHASAAAAEQAAVPDDAADEQAEVVDSAAAGEVGAVDQQPDDSQHVEESQPQEAAGPAGVGGEGVESMPGDMFGGGEASMFGGSAEGPQSPEELPDMFGGGEASMFGGSAEGPQSPEELPDMFGDSTSGFGGSVAGATAAAGVAAGTDTDTLFGGSDSRDRNHSFTQNLAPCAAETSWVHEKQWYVNTRLKEQLGPLSVGDLSGRWGQDLNEDCLTWANGYDNWQPIKEIPDLLAALQPQQQQQWPQQQQEQLWPQQQTVQTTWVHEKQWYVNTTLMEQLGPLSISDLLGRWGQDLNEDCQAWANGQANWQPIKEIPDLLAAFQPQQQQQQPQQQQQQQWPQQQQQQWPQQQQEQLWPQQQTVQTTWVHEKQWYVNTTLMEQLGPLSISDLLGRWGQDLNEDCQAWANGQANWQPIKEIPDLLAAFQPQQQQQQPQQQQQQQWPQQDSGMGQQSQSSDGQQQPHQQAGSSMQEQQQWSQQQPSTGQDQLQQGCFEQQQDSSSTWQQQPSEDAASAHDGHNLQQQAQPQQEILDDKTAPDSQHINSSQTNNEACPDDLPQTDETPANVTEGNEMPTTTPEDSAQHSKEQANASSEGANDDNTLSGGEEADLTVEELWALADRNGDGIISRREFKKAVSSSPRVQTCLGLNKPTFQQLKVLFDEIDTDDSGNLSYEELESYFNGESSESAPGVEGQAAAPDEHASAAAAEQAAVPDDAADEQAEVVDSAAAGEVGAVDQQPDDSQHVEESQPQEAAGQAGVGGEGVESMPGDMFGGGEASMFGGDGLAEAGDSSAQSMPGDMFGDETSAFGGYDGTQQQTVQTSWVHEKQWYANTTMMEQLGPLSISDLLGRWGQDLNEDCQAWTNGYDNWQPIKEIPDLLAALQPQQQQQPQQGWFNQQQQQPQQPQQPEQQGWFNQQQDYQGESTQQQTVQTTWVHEKQWYANTTMMEQLGPLSISDLLGRWGQDLNEDCQAWTNGYDNWQPIKEIPDLLAALQPQQSVVGFQTSYPQQQPADWSQQHNGSVQQSQQQYHDYASNAQSSGGFGLGTMNGTDQVPNMVQPDPNQSWGQAAPVQQFDPYQGQNSSNGFGSPQPASWSTHQSPSTVQAFDPYQSQQNANPSERPPHPAVSFGFGGKLIMAFSATECSVTGGVVPPVKFKQVGQLLSETASYSSLEKFPGPLVPSMDTKLLSEYVSSTTSTIQQLQSETARDQTILWKMLHLMCTETSRIMQVNQDGTLPDSLKQAISVLRDEGMQQQQYSGMLAHHNARDLDTSSVENLLIDGKRQDALSQAEASGHWGVALIIARSMGEQVWGEAVARLAAQFDQDSPLGNFIQVCSGQSSLDRCGAQKRWPETLAMLLANPSRGGHQQRIAAMGRSLQSTASWTAAAHTCYLMAEMAPQPHDYKGGAAVVLLGGDHQCQPTGFCTPHTIQCTEMLEAALTHANSQFKMPALQPYKLVYAQMLAEYGFTKRANDYVKTIQGLTSKCRSAGWQYHPRYLAELDSLAKRLGPSSANEGGGFLSRISSSIFGGSKDTPPAMDVKPQRRLSTDASSQGAQNPPPQNATPTKGGFFSSIVESISGSGSASKPPEGSSTVGGGGQLDDDTDFYFNEELGRWVERGKENESAPEAAAPPPKASGGNDASQGSNSMGAMAGPGAPTAPTAPRDRKSRLASLRYVNTYGGNPAAPQVPQAAAPTPEAKAKPQITMMTFGPPQ